MTRVLQKALFRGRAVAHDLFAALVRKPWWRLQGMTIGRGATIRSLEANWPHKIAIGERCQLEPGIFFKFDGIWSPGRAIEIGAGTFLGRGTEFNIVAGIRIGADALIGSGCKFIDHDHGIAPGRAIGPQPVSRAPITVDDGAWLGVNVIVLQGVTIGAGAVVAAGAVVTHSVPPNEIWSGVPARRVGSRSERAERQQLTSI